MLLVLHKAQNCRTTNNGTANDEQAGFARKCIGIIVLRSVFCVLRSSTILLRAFFFRLKRSFPKLFSVSLGRKMKGYKPKKSWVALTCLFWKWLKVGKRPAPLRRPGQAVAQSFGLKTPPVEGAFRRASPLGAFGRQSERTVRECSQNQGFSIASAEIAEGWNKKEANERLLIQDFRKKQL